MNQTQQTQGFADFLNFLMDKYELEKDSTKKNLRAKITYMLTKQPKYASQKIWENSPTVIKNGHKQKVFSVTLLQEIEKQLLPYIEKQARKEGRLTPQEIELRTKQELDEFTKWQEQQHEEAFKTAQKQKELQQKINEVIQQASQEAQKQKDTNKQQKIYNEAQIKIKNLQTQLIISSWASNTDNTYGAPESGEALEKSLDRLMLRALFNKFFTMTEKQKQQFAEDRKYKYMDPEDVYGSKDFTEAEERLEHPEKHYYTERK